MTHEDLLARTQAVFRRVFGTRVPFAPDLSRLNEPRWTSLKHVEFIVALEGEFGVRFDGADATDMTSIPSVLDRVSSRVA
jgi:acyl carrier protein